MVVLSVMVENFTEFRSHIVKCKFYFVVVELIYSTHDEDKINFKLEQEELTRI